MRVSNGWKAILARCAPDPVSGQRRRQVAQGSRPQNACLRLHRAGPAFGDGSHPDLEQVVALARRQSWLTAEICFLDRAGQIFKMWRVVP